MKKFSAILSIIISISIVIASFAFMTLNANAIDNTIGDANSDGSISSFDALVVIRYTTGEGKLTDAEITAADVDLSGDITSTDALYILNYSVGNISYFPATKDSQGNRVQIIGGFWYDPATGKVTNESGSGLLGFSYDASDKVFYASANAWQRNYGYTYLYDIAAPLGICWYDTTRIYFEYDEKEWMIQLWKGQYGWALIGCEIGLYYRDINDTSLIDSGGRKYYKCADDEMLIEMDLSMYRDNILQFSRKQQYSWWLTGFIPGALKDFGFTPSGTSVLTVDSTMYFTEEEMMNAFVNGLKSVTGIEHNVTKDVRDFHFIYGKNYTVNTKNLSVSFTWD